MQTHKRRTALILAAAAAAASVMAGVAPAQAVVAEDLSAVVSTVRNADGTITETIYSPAEGVSPAALAQRLRDQGVSNVIIKDGASPTVVAPCTYGTARTWPSETTCFVRWSYQGAARPIIDFVDHSSAAWPVGRAVTKWNETSGIDSIYRTASAGCDGVPAHCVHVYSANHGPGWTGRTQRRFNAAQTYYTWARSDLNDYYGGTEAQRWKTSCHELGHVLGLGHNTSSTTSCMYATRTSIKVPNSHDFTLLERYY